MTKVARPAAQPDHEIVVSKLPHRRPNASPIHVDVEDLGHVDLDVWAVGQDGPDGLGDVGLGKPSGGNLIKERLEEMVVLAVNQDDVCFRMPERAAEGKPGKPSTQHDDFLAVQHTSSMTLPNCVRESGIQALGIRERSREYSCRT